MSTSFSAHFNELTSRWSVSLVFRWAGWCLFVLPVFLGWVGRNCVTKNPWKIYPRISTAQESKMLFMPPFREIGVGAGGAGGDPNKLRQFWLQSSGFSHFSNYTLYPWNQHVRPSQIDGWKMKMLSLVGASWAYCLKGFLLLVSGSVSGHLFGLNAWLTSNRAFWSHTGLSEPGTHLNQLVKGML